MKSIFKLDSKYLKPVTMAHGYGSSLMKLLEITDRNKVSKRRVKRHIKRLNARRSQVKSMTFAERYGVSREVLMKHIDAGHKVAIMYDELSITDYRHRDYSSLSAQLVHQQGAELNVNFNQEMQSRGYLVC